MALPFSAEAKERLVGSQINGSVRKREAGIGRFTGGYDVVRHHLQPVRAGFEHVSFRRLVHDITFAADLAQVQRAPGILSQPLLPLFDSRFCFEALRHAGFIADIDKIPDELCGTDALRVAAYLPKPVRVREIPRFLRSR